MLTHGVRDFFVSRFRGRPIDGQVYRANNDHYGQCIILCISGECSRKDAKEGILNFVNESGQPYWHYGLVRELFHAIHARRYPWTKLRTTI
jgi:hypothetical protein